MGEPYHEHQCAQDCIAQADSLILRIRHPQGAGMPRPLPWARRVWYLEQADAGILVGRQAGRCGVRSAGGK